MKSKLKITAGINIWIVIYPVSTLFLYWFKEPLSVMPIYARTLLMTVSLIPIIVFAGTPIVDTLISYFRGSRKDKTETR